MLKSFLAISVCTLSAFASVGLMTQPASAQARSPITRLAYYRADNTSMTADFIVPDRNPRQPVARGKLRQYDIHVAKMVEVTDYLCGTDRNVLRINWQYSANQGKTRVGAFTINCSVARDAAVTYGLGKPERTRLLRDNRFAETRNIPTLNINRATIASWLNFAKNLSSAQ